ncbi:hypothetical protein GcM3_160021 [Golovinomyces cichoracearum]|uniref:Uncharacterized protein n=1 Tax=Golovinomyces cichoracearum TaxID=62708 RepID=A0A420HU87_9PEZI|nr:hypothetical protein GcM3_160021 [Golovinomyces cichoracearum]
MSSKNRFKGNPKNQQSQRSSTPAPPKDVVETDVQISIKDGDETAGEESFIILLQQIPEVIADVTSFVPGVEFEFFVGTIDDGKVAMVKQAIVSFY